MKPVKPSLRKRIKNLLKSNVCTITFTKADGTERVLTCTLLEQFLPPQNENKTRKKAPSDEAIAVWDLENDGWRSFRYDSVTSMKIKTGNTEVDILRDDTDE